jgi:hypothetical protein
MTNVVVVPEGEFTFQEICNANPTIKPMTVLKFVTEHVTAGKLVKNKIEGSARPFLYTPVVAEAAPRKAA